MRPFNDPAKLSPELRFGELCSILAAGLLRLRKRQWLAGSPDRATGKTSAESAALRLEVSEETVLSVHTG